jgi:hypothetical protein
MVTAGGKVPERAPMISTTSLTEEHREKENNRV